MYGKELILDLHNCDIEIFNRHDLEKYFEKLCRLIKMTRCDLHFWDDENVLEHEKQTSPHTKGTSAIQFILTSNITIHTLDLLQAVYINIFSCKDFNTTLASIFTQEWFKGQIVNQIVIDRL